MNAVNTHTNAYTRTHTAVFVTDKLRGLMKQIVTDAGLDPTKLVDAWSTWAEAAARKLLETGHLNKIIIEFYQPNSSDACGRWDFPIRYDGTNEEMWVDTSFFTASFAKAPRPPAGCTYRILFLEYPGAPDVGLVSTPFKSLGSLKAREAGTVIATSDIMASAVYYR